MARSPAFEDVLAEHAASHGVEPPAGSPTAIAPAPQPRRLSTGRLLFLILTFALAPLGAIAMNAGLSTIAASGRERQTLLTVTANEHAHQFAQRLSTNASRLAEALDRAMPAAVEAPPSAPALAGQPDPSEPSPLDSDTRRIIALENARDALLAKEAAHRAALQPICAAADVLFPGGSPDQIYTQIVDSRTGASLCAQGIPPDRSAIGQPVGTVRIDTAEKRLVMSAAEVGDFGRAEIIYPLASILRSFSGQDGLPRHRLTLENGPRTLVVRDRLGEIFPGFDIESSSVVGQTGLTLTLRAAPTWFNSSELIGLLTPLGMWLLAAILSWLVIDRVLLSPIIRLQTIMAQYRPGDRLDTGNNSLLAAREIVTLKDMLATLTSDVATDKSALADGLDQQRSLTREVHHRVKNNLQIIASLINLHSRDAVNTDAAAAYRTIQRRVDALAVVHRHLHAESEQRAGIALRTMVGELSVALRSSFASECEPPAIILDIAVARVNQDVALPVAFFATELVELAWTSDPTKVVTIQFHPPDPAAQIARLVIASASLCDCAERDPARYASYDRVLNGLARQLRSPLEVDARIGRYALLVPVIGS